MAPASPVMQKPLGFAYAWPLGPSARPIAVSDRGYSVGQTALPTRMGAHHRTCRVPNGQCSVDLPQECNRARCARVVGAGSDSGLAL